MSFSEARIKRIGLDLKSINGQEGHLKYMLKTKPLIKSH